MKRKIRTSTAIVSGLVLFLILLILTGIVYIRVLAGRGASTRDLSGSPLGDMEGDSITLVLVETIREVSLSGAWEAEILHSDTAEVTITLSREAQPSDIRWETRGDSLFLNYTGKIRAEGNVPKAVIKLPELVVFESEAATDTTFSGFNQEELRISSAGAIDLTGKDSRFSRVFVSLSGAGSIDLSDAPAENAEVHLSGAGSIRLHMDGGDLEGSLSGLGSIEYSGSVGKVRVNQSGLGSVDYID